MRNGLTTKPIQYAFHLRSRSLHRIEPFHFARRNSFRKRLFQVCQARTSSRRNREHFDGAAHFPRLPGFFVEHGAYRKNARRRSPEPEILVGVANRFPRNGLQRDIDRKPHEQGSFRGFAQLTKQYADVPSEHGLPNGTGLGENIVGKRQTAGTGSLDSRCELQKHIAADAE